MSEANSKQFLSNFLQSDTDYEAKKLNSGDAKKRIILVEDDPGTTLILSSFIPCMVEGVVKKI